MGGQENTRIRVVIADDHGLILEGTRRALERSDDMEVVGEARRGDAVVPVVEQTSPDVVLLDMRMPGMDGLEVLDVLREDHPEIKVVMLSANGEPEQISAALARGASAYVLKSVNPIDIPSAVRQALDGTVYRAVQGAAPAADAPPGPGGPLEALTEREQTILRAVATGQSTKTISRDLWVTEKTVKFHLTNIYRKLGVANRASAVRLAIEHGLVDD